jgi:hypothetical protein
VKLRIGELSGWATRIACVGATAAQPPKMNMDAACSAALIGLGAWKGGLALAKKSLADTAMRLNNLLDT